MVPGHPDGAAAALRRGQPWIPFGPPRQVDVDAGQLTSESVVARARELLRREGRLDEPVVADVGAPPDLRQRGGALAGARDGMRPPDLGTSRSGAAGRTARLAKMAVRKAAYWYVEPRLEAQGRFDDEVVYLAGDIGAAHSALEGAISHQSASIQWLGEHTEQALTGLRRRCDDLEREVASLRTALAEAARSADLEREVVSLRSALAETARGDALAALRAQVQEIALGSIGITPELDYVSFEDHFRGSSEEVRLAQRDYVQVFAEAPEGGRVVDIGCGRGEMLSLLSEAGIDAMGIDIDEGMLAVCAAQGFTVQKAAAVDWVRNQPDASLRGIYLAQVVEHLPTVDLVALVKEAARVLAPGGAFLAETIDPRSLYATANYFWADLSHVRPVHPATLAFLCQQAGFASVDVRARSPHPLLGLGDDVADEPTRAAIAELARSVFGTQDYAVVARR
jgi:SAM-dependent methyltransferase